MLGDRRHDRGNRHGSDERIGRAETFNPDSDDKCPRPGPAGDTPRHHRHCHCSARHLWGLPLPGPPRGLWLV